MQYTMALMTSFSTPRKQEPPAASKTEEIQQDSSGDRSVSSTLLLTDFSPEALAELMATTPLGDVVGCPTDPDAPLLPLSDLEPPPVSRLPLEVMGTAGVPLSKQAKRLLQRDVSPEELAADVLSELHEP